MPGVDAFGTQFKRDSTGTGVFVTIANVSDISGPGREREAIETTSHDSANKYREYAKGLKNGGTVEITINYDPSETTHEALDDDFEEEDLRDYQIVLLPGEADEHTWEFTALITNIGDEFPVDNRMERSVTLQISGKPNLTATGS